MEKNGRTITQILFSRKREVDIFPKLYGRQIIVYPARRNPKLSGCLSAMLCKSCVVALKGDIIGVNCLKSPGVVMIRSLSQSKRDFHNCYLLEDTLYLPRGKVTYHLGLLFLAEALFLKEKGADLLDALEELLLYREKSSDNDEKYLELLMHLADELYYFAKWRDVQPGKGEERLNKFKVQDNAFPPEVTLAESLDPDLLTQSGKLKEYRQGKRVEAPKRFFKKAGFKSKFRGYQLSELVESLDLGMSSLLVGPTATGKSLCAFEAFERVKRKKPVFVLEGHESLKEFDLLGGYVPDGKGSFLWKDGVLIQTMKQGGYLFLDEANRMPTRTVNILLGVLSREKVVLTEHGSEEIKAKKDFQVVMAMNLGKGYAVNTLDTALLNRFPCTLEFRYLPQEEEEELLVEKTGLDREIAKVMVKVANETRSLKRGKELSGEITPRGLFAWADKFKAKKEGSTLIKLKVAAKVTWMHQVAGTDSDGYLREDGVRMLFDLIEAHTPK